MHCYYQCIFPCLFRSLPSPNYEMVNKIIDGHLDLQSPCSNTSVMALMSPPIPLIRSTSSSPSRPAGTSKKSNKRHTPYGRRPAKNTTANCHFPPPFKRTVSLKDDEVVKILPATSSYPCWTSSCHFDRPLPLVPSLSFHKSWHTTEVCSIVSPKALLQNNQTLITLRMSRILCFTRRANNGANLSCWVVELSVRASKLVTSKPVL